MCIRDRVKMAIRPLTDCATEVSDALRKDWTSPNAAPVAISAAADAALRSWSQPDGYDLIVSGGCSGLGAISLTFALAAIRNADDLYQPASVAVGGTLADVTQTGASLMTFQHGDYARAADQLTNLPLDVQSRDLAVLRASALLFEQRYDEAIASLRELTRQNPTWSAAHINLGVALYNQSLLKSGLATAGGEKPRYSCLFYTSDAADARSSVDLGGRRFIKKKKNNNHIEALSTRTTMYYS